MNKFWMIANFTASIWFGTLCIATQEIPLSMIPNMVVGIYFAYKSYVI